jgi:hypothetical protein
VEHRVTHPEEPTEKLTATQGNGVKPSRIGTCQRAESQDKRRARSFFEAGQVNCGPYACGFPLRR